MSSLSSLVGVFSPEKAHYGSLQGLRTYSPRLESENLTLEPVSWPAKWYQALNPEGEK